jgi:predicted nucleotidyltransferase
MPRAPTLPIFRSRLQVELLGLLLLNPERGWQTSELAERIEATRVSVHRELHRALDSGLIVRDPVGRTYVYRAAVDSPLFDPLSLLLERTVGVEQQIRAALEGLPGVDAAFIHGSFARGAKIRPLSDVDLLVLGNVDHRSLRRRLRAVERRSGREIDVRAYQPAEFAALTSAGNSFARGILRGPVRPLIGSSADLPGAA